MIKIHFHEWEARLVGFTMPWWCAVLLGFPGPWQEPRSILGMVSLAMGALLALWTLASDAQGRARSVANWFLIGLVSMPVAFIVTLLVVGIERS